MRFAGLLFCQRGNEWLLRETEQHFADARDDGFVDERALVSLGLPDLQRQVDERNKHGNTADEAAEGREIGKRHGLPQWSESAGRC